MPELTDKPINKNPSAECSITIMIEVPEPGSVWKHYNGAVYTVLHIANEPDDRLYRDRYPITVVYQGSNGKVWTRRADDWLRAMTFMAPPKVPTPTEPPNWVHPPVPTSGNTETLTPTYRLHWSKYYEGVLEQLFLDADGKEHWKPVPRE